jgi:glycerol-3-phosphate acyltransferase PlsY
MIGDVAIDAGIIVVAYLLGAVPFGLVVGWRERGIDIRRYGSGSTGATNVLRTLGWRASAMVFVGDFLKTVIPVVVAGQIASPHALAAWVQSAAGVAAVAGHCWSPFSNWSGGRGSTSSLAGMIVIQPILGVACGLIAAITVLRTGYMSLGSLLATGFGAIVMLGLVLSGTLPPGDIVWTIGAPVIVYWRHRENLRRLLAGTERKITTSFGHS